MYTEKTSELEDQLRRELIDCISEPSERARAFSIIKRYNHSTICAVMNDFQLTLEAKRDSILQNFPIE